MIKFFAAAIIMFSSTALGFLMCDKLKGRSEELREIKEGFSILKSEISFSHSTLPIALSNVSNKSGNTVKIFFLNIAKLLENNEVESVMEAFKDRINKDFKYLKEYDKEFLIEFSKSLGSMDKEGQINLFQILDKRITQVLEKAEEEKEKNCKMYKALGFSLGAVVTILLL